MTTARDGTGTTGAGHAGRARRGRPRTGAREALLAATEVLLAESGVARLTTKELSQRAGVAESSIYYHFGDRLGLLQAVVAASLPLYRDVAAHLRDRAGRGTLRDNLIELVAALETFSLRVQPIIAAVQADAELRAVFTQRSRDLDIGPHRAVEPTLEYLVCERDAGRIGTDSDLHSVAYLLVSAAQHRALQRHLHGSAPRALPPATQLVDALLPLLAVHRPADP